MTEIVGGLLMMSGGSMLLGAGLRLARHTRFADELVAALPFTPLPPRNDELEKLIASID